MNLLSGRTARHLAPFLCIATPIALLTIPGCGGGNGGGFLGGQTATPVATTTATPIATTTGTPVATATSTATPLPTATTIGVTGQNFSGRISAASGFNGLTSSFIFPELASSYFGTFVTPTFDNGGTPSPRTVQFTLVTTAGTVAPGTYPVVARVSGTGRQATAFYNEGISKGWEGTSGSIIVDPVVGDVFKFRFVGVQMNPGRRFGSTASTGTFTLDGQGNARASCLTRAGCS